MLEDVVFDKQQKERLSIVESTNTTRLQKGIYLTDSFNFDHMITNKIKDWIPVEFNPHAALFHMRLHKNYPESHEAYDGPDPRILRRLHTSNRYINEYGVVDTPEQLLSLYDFNSDSRKLAISFVLLEKENMEPRGGWRWHKWGEYLGTQDPQCEYLYDEPVIEKVCVFHIHKLL